MIPDWKSYPLGAEDEAFPATMRVSERTGRPLGGLGFIAGIGRLTGMSLARRKPGPKPSS